MASAREVQLPGTEVHLLRSDAVGDDFEISIVLPPPQMEGPVPVVYMTDANGGGIGFGAYVLSVLVGSCEIPPVLGVGVGYAIGNDLAEFLRLRTRDFSPTEDAQQLRMQADLSGLAEVSGGGARAFLTFLTQELRPWRGSGPRSRARSGSASTEGRGLPVAGR